MNNTKRDLLIIVGAGIGLFWAFSFAVSTRENNQIEQCIDASSHITLPVLKRERKVIHKNVVISGVSNELRSTLPQCPKAKVIKVRDFTSKHSFVSSYEVIFGENGMDEPRGCKEKKGYYLTGKKIENTLCINSDGGLVELMIEINYIHIGNKQFSGIDKPY